MKKVLLGLLILLTWVGGIKAYNDISDYNKSNEMIVSIMKMGIGGHSEVKGKICGIKVRTTYDIVGNHIEKTVHYFD